MGKTRLSPTLVLALGLILIGLACRDAGAQQCDLIVTPVDGKSGFLSGLKAESIRARIGSTSLKAVSSSPYVGSQRVILILDFSDSMKRFWSTPETARLVIDDFVESSRPGVSIGAVVFARNTRTISPTPDRELFRTELTEAIRNVTQPKWQSSSAIFDAVVQAGKMMEPLQLGDTLYLITDGLDNRSKATLGTLKKLLSDGPRLFLFLRSEPDPTEPEEITAPGYLRDLADFSGGYTFEVSAAERMNPKTYEPRLSGFFRNLREFYVVHFEGYLPSENNPRPSVEILDATGIRRSGVVVFVWSGSNCRSRQ